MPSVQDFEHWIVLVRNLEDGGLPSEEDQQRLRSLRAYLEVKSDQVRNLIGDTDHFPSN